MSKTRNGFASMDPEKRKAIARKGGESVSRNREHMAAIGRLGGLKSGETRDKKKEESKPEQDGVHE